MTDEAPHDNQQAGSGKIENDRNRRGKQPPTQKNEARRSPASRHDRESQLGSDNQSRARRGNTGGAR